MLLKMRVIACGSGRQFGRHLNWLSFPCDKHRTLGICCFVDGCFPMDRSVCYECDGCLFGVSDVCLGTISNCLLSFIIKKQKCPISPETKPFLS